MAEVSSKRGGRGRAAVKTTVSLSPDAVESLRAMALARNTTLAEVIRRALSVDKFLSDAAQAGCKILVEDPDKMIKELLIF